MIGVALMLAAVLAQTPPNTASGTGTISGVVRDAATGLPMRDVDVYAGPARQQHSVTDAEGRYTLRGVSPGTARVSANARSATGGFSPGTSFRMVTLERGQEVAGIDFALRLPGAISGRIVDQNREPVPEIMVMLIAREYSLGALRHVFASATRTDDRGEYVLANVQPGRAYLVMVKKAPGVIDPVSSSPLNPKLRRPAVVSTFYPGVPSVESAQPITLRPGERRENTDIRVVRTPSYCVDGTIATGAGPAPLRFLIDARQPSSGASGNGAMFVASPGGTTSPDGKIRVCDLAPGDYQLTVHDRAEQRPLFFGVAPLLIADEDVRSLAVTARPAIPVPGEVVWEGDPPEQPESATLSIYVRPMTRAPWRGEMGTVKAAIPGKFAFEPLLMDDYALQISGVPAGLYVKDATYGNHGALREPLRVGTAIGDAALRIVMAADGGTINFKVEDRDNRPVPDASIVLMPAGSGSEAAMAAAMVLARTDQNGAWKSARLAPGKYYGLALQQEVDLSPESVARLWRARTRANEIDLGPRASVQVTLRPATLE